MFNSNLARPSEPEKGDGAVKLSDFAYAKIFGRISSGEYAVSSRLPTENELAELFSVSRPIVREALARLREEGIVVSRRGSGTYVRRLPDPKQTRLAPLSSINDMRLCLEFRISIEGEIAWHAARRTMAREPLAQAIARLEEGLGHNELSIEDDYAFHYAVAQCSGNRFFQSVVADLRESVTTGMQITRSFGPALYELHQEHLAIYEAIQANAPDAARTAMRLHLENVMRRAFEGFSI